jgi:altronate hydrolase
MKIKVLKVYPSDNLIVAHEQLEKLEEVVLDGIKYILPNAIEAKNKYVTHNLGIGDTVKLYGERVGKAIQKIKQGEKITTFNIKHESEEFPIKNRVPKNDWLLPDISKWKNRTFLGYLL